MDQPFGLASFPRRDFAMEVPVVAQGENRQDFLGVAVLHGHSPSGIIAAEEQAVDDPGSILGSDVNTHSGIQLKEEFLTRDYEAFQFSIFSVAREPGLMGCKGGVFDSRVWFGCHN